MGLEQEANDMGLSPSEINVQLAFFKREMNGNYSSYWNAIKSYKDVDSVSDEFFSHIEVGRPGSEGVRRQYSNKIYDQMSTF